MEVEGEWSDTCAEVPPIYEDINAITKPVIKRHGSVTSPETRSFLPGRMSQFAAFFTFKSKYQTRASEGILYRKILVSSMVAEKPAVSPAVFVIEPAEPDRNRTT
jgi:hypothetical protein